jgi:hypothetical protein
MSIVGSSAQELSARSLQVFAMLPFKVQARQNHEITFSRERNSDGTWVDQLHGPVAEGGSSRSSSKENHARLPVWHGCVKYLIPKKSGRDAATETGAVPLWNGTNGGTRRTDSFF